MQISDDVVRVAVERYEAAPDAMSSDEAMRAALEAALAAMWMQIEEAPKDGSEILVAGINSSKRFYRAIAKWDGAWMLFDPMMDDYTAESSGHSWWAPLPSPPSTNKEDGK